ncbi:Lysophospholipase, alpha-beta hydrolase superfamily [Streptomyces sp. yr375]|uniref:alpha/beta hydrolase n=1 Tax=Streptomyces sp. yr375 TaxID=1761906 RepID=UPI0008B0607A|nr:alpha/beta fold hydrolase [Streptomyces sp. yr375]SEQ10947.1 Lysophospholipase, alpha-beta hydrolase superfamily [Streptomyces sp. yr375]
MPAHTPTDYSVPHISTIPANSGANVNLFVREYDGTKPGHTPQPVLMLHGRSVPAVAGFDLVLPPGGGGPATRYSWAQDLADDGYDVFLMDLQGSGRSPRPQMDAPCNANPAQQNILIPNPLAATCAPPYPHQLGNSESEWAELSTVVQFIRALPGRNHPIDFVGWSAAAFVMGPYTLQHPGDVRNLLLLAPIFPPQGRWSTNPADPFGRPPDASTLPLSLPAVTFGYPMYVGSKTGFKAGWDKEQASPLQREPGIEDKVWAACMENDPVGSQWGPALPTGGFEGILRYRNTYWWGWNDRTVPHEDPVGTHVLGDRVPVLILYGEQDTSANTSATLPPVLHFSTTDLYEAVQGPRKLMFELAGAGHSVPWERNSKVVQRFARSWLDKGKIEGLSSGSYYRDDDGALFPI